jgi:hypothetical protein
MPRLSIHSPSRRELLRLGGIGALGLLGGVGSTSRRATAADSVAAKSPGFGRAKSVVLVYCCGGQSQIDTWDPKPEAPETVRGAFETIDTAVPGTFVTAPLPRLARCVDKLTIVRSMSHDDLDHGTATYLTLTGKRHKIKSGNPPVAPTDEPTLSSVLRAVRPNKKFPYDAVHLNAPLMSPREPSVGQNAGYLGTKYEPLLLGNVLSQTSPLPDLESLPDLPPVRMHDRQTLKETLDGYVRDIAADAPVRDANTRYLQALELLDRPQTRTAFDLSLEPEPLKDRYGRNQSGQALLLARRLVEAGLPLITVFWSPTNRGQDTRPDDTDAYGWDTHNDIFTSLSQHLLPRFDLGFSALLEDLDDRGLLDSTLVVCVGEFGRAPLVAYEAKFAGNTPGRKHWANVYSMICAGAGVSRGKIVGASDRIGDRPDSQRYGPWDTIATIFAALGIDPTGHYHDSLGRPIPLCTGRPIGALYT